MPKKVWAGHGRSRRLQVHESRAHGNPAASDPAMLNAALTMAAESLRRTHPKMPVVEVLQKPRLPTAT